MDTINAPETAAPTTSPTSSIAARKHRWAVTIGTGLLTGLLLGASARGFMRLLTTEPEFTWSGTLFIIGLFTVFGFVQGLVAVVRARTTRHWITAPVRLLGGLSYLLLGGGAGIVMILFLWCGGLAMWRTDWMRPARMLLAAVASINVIGLVVLTVMEEDLQPIFVAGFLVLIGVYLATLWTAGPTLRPSVGAHAASTGRESSADRVPSRRRISRINRRVVRSIWHVGADGGAAE